MLFDDIFEINDVDPQGKKFDKVSRIHATSENYEMSLVLDYNCEIYSLKLGDIFNLKLTHSISYDKTNISQDYSQSTEPSLLDDCEYCMHGTVFKIQAVANMSHEIILYISFGGLIMSLKGQSTYIQKISLDDDIYLLITKR